MFWGHSKEPSHWPSHWGGLFEYPQYMLWFRNKINNLQLLQALILGPAAVCFGCSKEPSHWDGSEKVLKDCIDYTQHMVWLREKINNFQLPAHISGSHWDCSFEYPQYMFWLRYKINNFQLQAPTWGAQKNRLIETVLLRTHNICLGREIR